MTVETTPLRGLLVFTPRLYPDARGAFMESWNRRQYEAAGLTDAFVQDNLSRSEQGVLRGLHYQHPRAQGKLIQVLDGSVYDVAVDLRQSSPTFGSWYATVLSAENRRQLWVPKGFAHGFAVTGERALVHYKCSAYYHQEDEMTLRWDDPVVGVEWPLEAPILSSKDAAALSLREIPPDRLFE